MAFEWFMTMISVPRPAPPTKLARFHEVSGSVVYGLLGLVCLCVPDALHYILRVEYGGRAESYVRLLGVELIIVGFNYLVIGRTKPIRGSENGHILASVPERLILKNLLFLVLILAKALPLSVGLLIIIVDSTLALATFLVWYKTTEGATAGSYFRETFGPLLIRCVYGGRGPSVAVHAFGIIQFLIGFIFAIRPGYAQVVFQLERFRDHAAGYLGAFFAVLCQSAWHQIYMGKAVSLSFNIGNVFSRFAFKIPLLAILTATKQIDLGLFAFLGALDFIFGFIILLLLCLSELRENAQGPDETDAILPPKSNDDAASIKPRE